MASADRALQIVRWAQGLESERQFPYLELIVDIGIHETLEQRRRQAEHYTALLGQKYQGDAQTRLGHMLCWRTRMHRVRADTKQRRTYHLMQATRVSEIAVQYAQAHRLTMATPNFCLQLLVLIIWKMQRSANGQRELSTQRAAPERTFLKNEK